MAKSKFSEYPKFRIKGKTYYKVGEEKVNDDLSIISELWLMKNAKGEDFKLAIRYGSKTTSYIMYDVNGNRTLSTYSISEVV